VAGRLPHGETPKEVSDRADRLFEKLRDLEGNIALFSHGQFGCVLAARWIGLPAFADGISRFIRRASVFSATKKTIRKTRHIALECRDDRSFAGG